MDDYWTNELMAALQERGVSLNRPNMTAEDAANEYAMWHYGSRLASEMLSVFRAAEKVLGAEKDTGTG